MIYVIKERYLAAFEGCRPKYLVLLLQAYSVFCALMIIMAIYAIVYRMSTGFPI